MHIGKCNFAAKIQIIYQMCKKKVRFGTKSIYSLGKVTDQFWLICFVSKNFVPFVKQTISPPKAK